VSVGVADEAQPATDPGGTRSPSLVGALWRYRWAILVVTLLAAVVGYVYTGAQPPVYEAAGRVTLTNPFDRTLFRNERGVAFTDFDRYLNTQAARMTSPDVLSAASELLEGRLRPGQIRQAVEAESSTSILEVTVRARFEDPTEAANVVNAVIQAYQNVAAAQMEAQVEASVAQLAALEAGLQERLLALSEEVGEVPNPLQQSELDSLNARLAELQTKAGQIRADAAVFGAGIERVESAGAPELPVSETPRRMAAVFGLLGFIAALIGAFWRSERAQVIDSAADAAGAVGAPLLGLTSPNQGRSAAAAAAVVTAPDSAAAQEHQYIASKLALMGRESEPRVVLVTSPQDAAGRSVTALNLALSAALDQRTVILADLDPAGWLTGLLGADGKRGVSDLIARSSDGNVVVGDCVAVVDELSVDGFRFIPVGSAAADGGGTAAAPQLAKLLARLMQEADLIVLDGPPLLRVPASSKLAADADRVVLVVRRGTTFEDLRKATGLIRLAKAPFVGYVFDRSRPPRSWWPRRRTESRSGDRGSKGGPEGPVADRAEDRHAR
jgi:Mrp family chromosome partitioning ATPase/capsular polysaccharide biosynthesis protein